MYFPARIIRLTYQRLGSLLSRCAAGERKKEKHERWQINLWIAGGKELTVPFSNRISRFLQRWPRTRTHEFNVRTIT